MVLPDRQQLLRQAAIAHQQRSLSSTRPYLATAQGYNADRGQLILSVGNGKITAPSLSNGSVGNGTEVMLIGDSATHRPSQPLPLSPIITLPITPKYGQPTPTGNIFAWGVAVMQFDLEPPYFEAVPGYPSPTLKSLKHYIKINDQPLQLLYELDRTDIPYYHPYPPEFGDTEDTVARLISSNEPFIALFVNAAHWSLLDANQVLIYDRLEQQWGNGYVPRTVKTWLKNLSTTTLATYSDTNYTGGGFPYPPDGGAYSYTGYSSTYSDWLPSNNLFEVGSSVLYGGGSEIPIPAGEGGATDFPANVTFTSGRIPYRAVTNLGIDGYRDRTWFSDLVGQSFDVLTRANPSADPTIAFTQSGNLTADDLDTLGVTSGTPIKKFLGDTEYTRLDLLSGEEWYNQIVYDETTDSWTIVKLTGIKGIQA